MEEDLGKGLKMKSQDELIDKFVDAKSEILSTIPRTQEEHEEPDNLNNNFSERLEELEKESSLPNEKGNKKRVVTTQGRRDDSDSE
ncbi:unnamed protein product [Rhizophagus irregularis]|nr:unnamed protein product [Rhizophagus irregularis]